MEPSKKRARISLSDPGEETSAASADKKGLLFEGASMYCVVELKGYFASPYSSEYTADCDIFAERVLNASFTPLACRESTVQKKSQWLSLCLAVDLPEGVRNVRAPTGNGYQRLKNRFKEMLQRLAFDDVSQRWGKDKRIGADLYCGREFGESMRDRNALRSVLTGFLQGMSNSEGRTAVYALLELIMDDLNVEDDWQILNVGGGSKKSWMRRQICVLVVPNPDHESPKRWKKSPPSSPASRSSSELIEIPKPDYALLDEGSQVEQTCDLKMSVKDFMPDVVLHVYLTNRKPLELINISVKYGSLQSFHRAEAQLRYEMLPVLMEQGHSLGLVISATAGVLLKMETHRMRKQIVVYRKQYNFLGIAGNGEYCFVVEHLNQMMTDITHHCQLIYDITTLGKI